MDAPIELKYWLEDPTSEKAIAEAKRVRAILMPLIIQLVQFITWLIK
jgi:hypothetical protein